MLSRDKRVIILTLIKDIIREILIGKRLIDRFEIFKSYPWLKEQKGATLSISFKDKVESASSLIITKETLLDNLINLTTHIIFSNGHFRYLTLSDIDNLYIDVSIVKSLDYIRYNSIDDLNRAIRPNKDGILILYHGYEYSYPPNYWRYFSNFYELFHSLCREIGVSIEELLRYHPRIYFYQIEKAKVVRIANYRVH
jgi:hypothetical protein